MNADKDRASKKLLLVGLEAPRGDHNKHQETGVFASQNLRSSAFICGSLLLGLRLSCNETPKTGSLDTGSCS
jgi:hypothetical protein